MRLKILDSISSVGPSLWWPTLDGDKVFEISCVSTARVVIEASHDAITRNSIQTIEISQTPQFIYLSEKYKYWRLYIARAEGAVTAYINGLDAGQVVARKIVYAADSGAVGGTADDTNALLAVIEAAEPWTTIILSPATYSVQPDALTWNKHGVILSGAGILMPMALASASDPLPRLKFLADGGYGIKIGSTSNYTAGNATGMKRGCGIRGVLIDGNNKKFTEGGIVVYGLQYAEFDFGARYVGEDSSGRGCRTLFLRNVFDSAFQCTLVTCNAVDGDGIVSFGDQVADSAGNCNNLRFIRCSFEDLNGTHFYSTGANSGVGVIEIAHSKFEAGAYSTTVTKRLLDMSKVNRAAIHDNYVVNYTSSRNFDYIFKLGSQASELNVIKENQFSNCDVPLLRNEANAILTSCRQNYQLSGGAVCGLLNESIYPLDFEYPTTVIDGGLSGRGLNRSKRILRSGVGWQSIHEFTTTTYNAFVADKTNGVGTAGCQNIQGSVLRKTDAVTAGNVIALLQMEEFKDWSVDATMYVRCRRTQDGGTAALRLNANGNNIAGSAIAALPAALTGVTLSGDGTTVTATKTSHGLLTGDRVIIAGANEAGFNSTANQPVQITVTDANTFTYLGSGSGAATGSITAQKCQWQVISFALVAATHFAGLGDGTTAGAATTDRFRLEYGTSNDQPIDIDCIGFRM